MPVLIQEDSQLTLNQLIELQNQGFMVEQTPHIGNIAVRTLALLSIGLKAKLVDITIGEKDNLFFPHCVIQNGVATPIACPNTMTTHNTLHETGVSVTDFHISALERSNLFATSHSQWLDERQSLMIKIVSAITDNDCLKLWSRYVNQDGIVSEKNTSSKEDLLRQIHKITVNHDQAGWVIPNPINILLDIIAGATETEKEVVYMLSGQSMYKYIAKNYRDFGPMDNLISNLYDLVRRKVLPTLPETLIVKMVPTPVIRHFVAPKKFKTLLDNKLEYYSRLMKNNARCGHKLSERIISGTKMKYFRHKRERIFSAISSGLSHICCSSETGNFYSQHDLAINHDRIYIPDHVMNMTFSEMDKISTKFNQLIK